MEFKTLDPAKVRAGRASALKRWGPEPHGPSVARLAELTPAQRRLVLALVDAARGENQKAAPASETPEAAMSEVHGNARPAA